MACVLLPWLLAYLGLHVVQRGIIFIDIAMAQMAALGICVAILFHLELESWSDFRDRARIHISRCCNFFVTGKRTSQVPQEAVIGISYVVAAATAVLLLSRQQRVTRKSKTYWWEIFCSLRRKKFGSGSSCS